MNKLIFITGGARSGKSAFAEELAEEILSENPDQKIAYITTAENTDKEFAERIRAHQQRRGDQYVTFEKKIKLSELIDEIIYDHNIFIIECMNAWLGNVYCLASENIQKVIEKETNELLQIIADQNNNQSHIPKNSVLTLFKNNQVGKNHTEHITNGNNKDKFFIVVSNEVGTGIVPEDQITRNYRDDLEFINKKIAYQSDYVFHCICGIPSRLK